MNKLFEHGKKPIVTALPLPQGFRLKFPQSLPLIEICAQLLYQRLMTVNRSLF